jgi:hypothetical protein
MRRDPAKAIVVLAAMLEFFDGGRRWIRGQLRDKDGRRLVGALGYIRRQQRIRGAGTEHYLRRAMIDRAGDLNPLNELTIGMPGDGNLMRYNDLSTGYDEVRDLIIGPRRCASRA